MREHISIDGTVVSVPVSSAVWGNIIMGGFLIVRVGIEGGVSIPGALHIS